MLEDVKTWRRCFMNREKQLENGAKNPLNNWHSGSRFFFFQSGFLDVNSQQLKFSICCRPLCLMI